MTQYTDVVPCKYHNGKGREMFNEVAATQTVDHYGAAESNPINAEIRAISEAIDHGAPVNLCDPRLARVTRLRLVTDPGFPMYDVSYCYGELRDGTPVRVSLPFYQLPKRNPKGAVIEACKRSGVYAKRLGLLDVAGVWSVCS